VDWIIEERPWTDPAGAALREAQRAELDARYGTDDHEPGPPPSGDDVSYFVVATADGDTALGCGALRQLDGHSAEIKRMYVVPAARGTGVARAVLTALEDAARQRGWTTLRLETGTLQPDAQRFYRRAGYHEIPLFGSYVGSELSVCFERRLSA
jgi:GNAT superfamily N-acetyltransferase